MYLERSDLVVMDVSHLVVSEGGTCLVTDLKAGIELQSLQQLPEEVTL